jgi:hypothetical protein
MLTNFSGSEDRVRWGHLRPQPRPQQPVCQCMAMDPYSDTQYLREFRILFRIIHSARIAEELMGSAGELAIEMPQHCLGI